MNILITGATGFIGSQLAQTASEKGHCVIGLSSRCDVIPNCVHSFRRKFGERINDVLDKQPLDAAIHCSYDAGQSPSANIDGTRIWAEDLKMTRVRQIFISSISAKAPVLSPYGFLKNESEKWFMANDGWVVRPGLVIGSGGLFERMFNVVRKWPVIPLIDGGRLSVYYTSLKGLCDTLIHIAEAAPTKREWNIQQPKPLSLRDVLKETAAVLKRKRLFVSIPYTPCLWTAWLMSTLRIPFGFNYDNIAGLRKNARLDIASDANFESFRAVIRRNMTI